MSRRCPCYNPEEDAASTDSYDYADMPPLVAVEEAAAAAAAAPLFSAEDTRELKNLYWERKRDFLTEENQEAINAAIDEILALRADTLKTEMRTAIEGAKDIANLEVKLLNYQKFSLTDGRAFHLADYTSEHTTTLGGVEVDFLVRQTHFVRQLVERIGDPQHFIIKKRVGVVTEYDGYKVVSPTLWLEFWPKGVTQERKTQRYSTL